MSGRLLLFTILAYPVAELLSVMVVASLIGGVATFILLLGTGLLGILILRRAGRSALDALRGQRFAGSRGFMLRLDGSKSVLIGVLLLIPGFISDVIALGLCLPGIGHARKPRPRIGRPRQHSPV